MYWILSLLTPKSHYAKLNSIKGIFNKALDQSEKLVNNIEQDIERVNATVDDLQARAAEYRETADSARAFINNLRQLVD